MDRFFHSADLARPTLSLDEAESHHAVRVLRKNVGDRIELFDGRGQAVIGEITVLKKSSVEVRVVEQRPPQPQATPRITLAVAPPKGDRLKWLIEKATELGIDRFVPLQSERTVVEPGASKLETLRAAVVAACKQSGRNWVLEIAENTTLKTLLAPTMPSAITFIGDPAGPVFGPEMIPSEMAEVQILIGPEGGWTSEELALMTASGAISVRVSEHVLRTETAAIQFAGLAVWCREQLSAIRKSDRRAGTGSLLDNG